MSGRIRQSIFVCSSLTNEGDLFNKIISATSKDEAASLFQEQFSMKAKEIFGPFYRKKVHVLENTKVLRFTNQMKKAIYNEWVVNAFLLHEPENHAYLVFIKRADERKLPIPKGTVTVPISDLRFT